MKMTRQWVAVIVVGIAILAVASVVKSCNEEKDPYQLRISEEEGFELVVPQD